MLYSDNNPKVVENRKDFLYLSRIYAHGDLEDLLEYDILFTNSIELFNDIYNWHHENDMFIRIHKVEDLEGNVHEVNMYLWRSEKTGLWQGLVCLVGDEESNTDAKSKYEAKAVYL